MSESSNSAWPFGEISDKEGLDIAAIFKDSADTVDQGDPFAAPVEPAAPAPTPRDPETPAAPASKPTAAPPAEKPAPEQPEVSAAAENPIAAAFEQKTAENTKKGLLEKPPVFYHKGVKEEIEDPSMTFEELRIRKSEDFTDLEEGKRVSWSVEYCGIRKEIKDPKGTTIISVKETIERSREFLAALKKTKEKNPCCYVKPKVEMKTKGNAAYKGKFGSLEEARASDKVICMVPARNGRIYELRKMEQGEFIAPKNNVVDFSEIRAGFTPALPKIPAQLMGEIIAFFRALMTENEENEAFVQIYWDKEEKRFFAYVPKQSVCKDEVEADLRGCPYESIDELNHLAHVLSDLDQSDIEKFEAVIDSGEYTGSVHDLINLAQNLDCYDFYPGIDSEEALGRAYIEEMEMLDVPDNVLPYFDFEAYGRDARINDGGHFAPSGYVFNNGGNFVERYHGMEDIPPEHRIFAYPKLNIREQMAAYQEVIDRSALNEEKQRLPASREDR